MIDIEKVMPTVALDSTIGVVITEMYYLQSTYPAKKYIVYGSSTKGGSEPNDIDVMVVGHSTETGQKRVKGVLCPLDLQFITEDELQVKESELDPALLSVYIVEDGIMDISSSYSMDLFTKDLSKSRKAIAKAASNAYAKGHKKLTVLEDYDAVLGVKNIIHSISFPYECTSLLMSKLLIEKQGSDDSFEHVQYMLDVIKACSDATEAVENMAKIQLESGLDKEMVWNGIKLVAKPAFNEGMTLFRKHFPK